MVRELTTATIVASVIWVSAVPSYQAKSPAAQFRTQEELAAGSVLVANEKLGDPNFTESVVLIVQYDSDDGTLGVIINRRSKIPLSRIFPDIKAATADPVFVGGPVGKAGAMALLRLPVKTDKTLHVTNDVYVTGSKELIEKSVAGRAESSKFRLYMGYAGWAPGQLEAELQLGAWSVIKGSSRIVFDDDPDSLWSRLSRESHLQIAALN
ncbi:MAG: YqgE/AlgH family protein [Acidobacteriaceae bacterium]|nr:YqgE/AlgH family protein [Acidobacteriaceae bacterium]